MEYGHYFDLLGIEPTPYIRKMRAMRRNDDGRYGAGDYARYEAAMDAICSRKPHRMRPHRMRPNGLDMLRAKAMGVSDGELRAHVLEMYRELEAEVIALAR